MKTAFIILGHGSRRREVATAFASMTDRLRPRLQPALVEPAFFSLGSPSLEEKALELNAKGCTRIVVFPYFLFNGNHVLKDIPEMMDGLKSTYPNIQWELIDSLEEDPMMDELVFERLWDVSQQEIISSGMEIEQNSLEFIKSHLAHLDGNEREITARVIHAAADFTFVRNMRFAPNSVQLGKEALRTDQKVFCDVRMLAAGMTRAKNVRCLLDEVDGLEVPNGTTRAAMAVQKVGEELDKALLVVGNSPTSLWALLDLHHKTGVTPELVIGLPVGFVGAPQSKDALLRSGIPCITNSGPRGGSSVAAAAFNALCLLLEKENAC
ncbi:MAG: precorrin-8X methylmutase [Thermodesulfobacteriota bacterium]